MRSALVIFSTLLLGQVPLSAEESKWFVDTNLVYEKGSALSKKYLAERHPNFIGKIDNILPWLVRVEVRHNITPKGYTSNHGTGVILEGGKVITAKHVLTKNVKDLKSKTKILLTTPDGRVFDATVAKKGKADWMMLQMDLQPDQENMRKSPIQVSAPKKDETTVFFGYPARLGLDDVGKVQSFHKGNKKKNIPVSKLEPMLVIGSVSDPNALTIKPIAGFPPVGGMSGGPMFNLRGEVVAAQHSVTKTTSDATGKVLKYRIDAVPSTLFKP